MATLSSQGALGAKLGNLPFPSHSPNKARKPPPRCQTQFCFLHSAFLADWRLLTAMALILPPTAPMALVTSLNPSCSLQAKGPLCSCWLAGSPAFAALAVCMISVGAFFGCFLAFSQGSGSRQEGEDSGPVFAASCEHLQSGCAPCTRTHASELPLSSCSRRCHSSSETPG